MSWDGTLHRPLCGMTLPGIDYFRVLVDFFIDLVDTFLQKMFLPGRDSNRGPPNRHASLRPLDHGDPHCNSFLDFKLHFHITISLPVSFFLCVV